MGIKIPEIPEQVLVLQSAGEKIEKYGGVRVVTVREFVNEIFDGLKGTSPLKKAVPTTLPLLRTVQVAADATRGRLTARRLVPIKSIESEI